MTVLQFAHVHCNAAGIDGWSHDCAIIADGLDGFGMIIHAGALVPVALSPLALYPTVSVSLERDLPTTSSDFVAYDQSGVLIPTLVCIPGFEDLRIICDSTASPGAA